MTAVEARTVEEIVPIVGGGPAGMSCALWLNNFGLHPVIIERKPLLGGMQRQSPYPNPWLLGRPQTTARENAEEFARHIEREAIETLCTASPTALRRPTEECFDLEVVLPGGATRTFRSRALVIATGTEFRSREWLDGIAGAAMLAKTGRILLDPAAAGEPGTELGGRVLVIGGGDNAFDVAQQIARPGRRVTVALRAAAPRAQRLLVERVRALEARGLAEIRRGVSVVALGDDAHAMRVTFDDGTTLAADRIVLCLGFTPNSGEAWMQGLGLRRDGEGYLLVDGNMETSCRGVFAVGDIANPVHPCTVTALATGAMAAREIMKRSGQG